MSKEGALGAGLTLDELQGRLDASSCPGFDFRYEIAVHLGENDYFEKCNKTTRDWC